MSLLAAVLRILAVTIVVALLLDAPAARAKPVATWAALDASASMARGDTTVWKASRDSIRRVGAESVFVFGDSVRRLADASKPGDQASLLRPAVERAIGAGHPLVVVTDGELDDPDAARQLPAGSRIVLVKHSVQRDLAVATLDVPRAIVSGDTVEIKVGVSAGSGGSRGGSLALSFDGKPVGTSPVDSLAAFGERSISIKARLEGAT